MSTKAKQQSSQQMTRGFEPYQETKGEEYMSEHARALHRDPEQMETGADGRSRPYRASHAGRSGQLPRSGRPRQPGRRIQPELRARDRERKLIKKIDETLQLIEDEEYGWCDSCGVEIGIRRLEARPTATLCIDCKTLAEIREKQLGS